MKKRRTIWLYLLPIAGIFIVLSVVLYFFHPIAPLLLWASILIQAPIIYLISRVNFDSAYRDRLYERRQRYQKEESTAEAETILEQEEREARSFGYHLLSRWSRQQNALFRAELMLALDRTDDAALLLDTLNAEKLKPADLERYNTIKEQTHPAG